MDSFKTLQDSISQALVATTRSATRLSAADIPFQRSLDPAVGTQLDEQNARLLQLAQRLLANAAASSDAVGPKLPDVDAIDTNWKGIIDVVDSLLERADTSLDEYTGVVKRLAPSADTAAAAATPRSRPPTVSNTYPKPQLSFENVPNNDETGGFRPLMTSKPHAKVPLEESLKPYTDDNGREQYPQPYQTEIESYKYPPSMYIKRPPHEYTPMESTSATFVDTPEALADMLAELKTAKEIAIDLEHHDNRSYIGIVSLMQISTRDKDWIVDTLKPWRRRLECLNEVFADPGIIKVFHGAFMDIMWLQRDLGLYVVGLFDTFHAARSLGYPGASLSFLLEKFVNFKAQKQYQMADWRIRPLPQELLDYARADTHFLLYIFDNMRNELIDRSDLSNPDKDKVSDVLEKSRETALQRYEHPVYDTESGQGPGGWYRIITRTPVQFTPQQFSVFRAVHKWRDDVARAEDESPLYIMQNHVLFSLARRLPEDKAALFGVIQNVSHVVRARADALVNIIIKAKNAEDLPELNDTLDKLAALRYAKREADATAAVATAAEATPAAPVVETVPLAGLVETPPLRAPASAFWGSICSKASAEQARSTETLAVDLALPLPPLTAEIFAENVSLVTPKPEKPEVTFVPKEERPEEDQRSDIFIVKQLGGKRKRATPAGAAAAGVHEDADMAGQADEVSLLEDDGDAERRAAKAAKKEARLARRELKRQQAAQQGASSGKASAEEESKEEEEEEAFDYTTAPSVLKAREAEDKRSGKMKKERRKKQGFNPYAKMADVPKGLARTQVEKSGRSKTFKS